MRQHSSHHCFWKAHWLLLLNKYRNGKRELRKPKKPLVPSSVGPLGGGGLFCCSGGITCPARLSSHLESARKTLRQRKVLVRGLLSREHPRTPKHEPRAASHQGFLKPGELFVLTFPISPQLSKMLF